MTPLFLVRVADSDNGMSRQNDFIALTNTHIDTLHNCMFYNIYKFYTVTGLALK